MKFLPVFYSVFILSCHAGILPTGTQNDHKSRVLDLVSNHNIICFLENDC